MTTVSEAIEVMGIVAACHHRTAPRMDDRDAVLATAGVWAQLFNQYRLDVDDLKAAVMQRASTHPDAPEPAEIIAAARKIRRDRADRWSDEDQADREAFIDAKASGRVTSLEQWQQLKAANRNRLADLINPAAARKGLTQGENA